MIKLYSKINCGLAPVSVMLYTIVKRLVDNSLLNIHDYSATYP